MEPCPGNEHSTCSGHFRTGIHSLLLKSNWVLLFFCGYREKLGLGVGVLKYNPREEKKIERMQLNGMFVKWSRGSFYNVFSISWGFRSNLAKYRAGWLQWEILDSPLRRHFTSVLFPVWTAPGEAQCHSRKKTDEVFVSIFTRWFPWGPCHI